MVAGEALGVYKRFVEKRVKHLTAFKYVRD